MSSDRGQSLGVASYETESATNQSGRSPDAQAPALPLVSIIVVNFNGIEVLPRCLSALNRLDYPHCEIILVDNGSRDGSAEFIESFSFKHPHRVLRFAGNKGLAAARNAGVRMARGAYLAFIDNDGFPEPDWLDAALNTFKSNPKIGVVASLVLFDRRPDIINGLGGGVNYRGFGFDHLCYRPVGFQPFPEDILYPMGCGMIIKKEAADLIFPIDKMLVNYYDDVEIGIRTWNVGYRVEPCAEAKVRHVFNHSSSGSHHARKEILCHRNRLRTVLKYWPLAKLPAFIIDEFKSLRTFMDKNSGALSAIFLWNFCHLGSVLWIRFRFRAARHFHLADKLHDKEVNGYPTNTDFSLDWDHIREVIDIGRADHESALDFGWYFIESIDRTVVRYAADIASAFLRTRQPANCFLLRFIPCTDAPFTVELRDRETRSVLHRWEFTGEIFKVLSVSRPVSLPPGDYQVILKCDSPDQLNYGRVLGLGVNFIGLWNLT